MQRFDRHVRGNHSSKVRQRLVSSDADGGTAFGSPAAFASPAVSSAAASDRDGSMSSLPLSALPFSSRFRRNALGTVRGYDGDRYTRVRCGRSSHLRPALRRRSASHGLTKTALGPTRPEPKNPLMVSYQIRCGRMESVRDGRTPIAASQRQAAPACRGGSLCSNPNVRAHSRWRTPVNEPTLAPSSCRRATRPSWLGQMCAGP
jgi:hypothetical protein